jgi:orotidine-5'-phosphate decarboxylase
MTDPKEKLIVALDVDRSDRALELWEQLRETVGMFKIGMQLFTAAGPELVRKIVAGKGRVFLDLKYHDIPNTVAMAAIEATRLGVSMFNVHCAGGKEMMSRTAAAVRDVAARENLEAPTILGVTLLTSIDEETLAQIGIGDRPAVVVRRLAALAQSAGLNGVVASAHELGIIRTEVSDASFVVVCPGIRSAQDPFDDQRRSMPVGDAIQAGADYVVVGRPILNAQDPAKASRMFLDEISKALTRPAQVFQVNR